MCAKFWGRVWAKETLGMVSIERMRRREKDVRGDVLFMVRIRWSYR